MKESYDENTKMNSLDCSASLVENERRDIGQSVTGLMQRIPPLGRMSGLSYAKTWVAAGAAGAALAAAAAGVGAVVAAAGGCFRCCGSRLRRRSIRPVPDSFVTQSAIVEVAILRACAIGILTRAPGGQMQDAATRAMSVHIVEERRRRKCRPPPRPFELHPGGLQQNAK